MIALSGVRSSWLMLARNWLLALLAASASRRASSSSLMSWYNPMRPTRSPATITGTPSTSTSTSESSLRRRRPMPWIGRSSACRVYSTASERVASVEMSSSRFRPIASTCVYPNSSSNAGLHDTTLWFVSSVTIATGLLSTRSSKYCFWRWAAAYSRAFSIAIAAWGANIVSSRRSSGPKMRSLSEWTVAIAPTNRRPIRSGAAITECTVTSAYCPERPSHSW